jgi:hypothetical protein
MIVPGSWPTLPLVMTHADRPGSCARWCCTVCNSSLSLLCVAPNAPADLAA